MFYVQYYSINYYTVTMDQEYINALSLSFYCQNNVRVEV